jgi:hypothetical protein
MASTMIVDPRDPHRGERLAERDRRYRESMQELDIADESHLERAARDRCQLCDSDGYRPTGTVCDHIDHAPAAARGMEKVRAALSKLPKS